MFLESGGNRVYDFSCSLNSRPSFYFSVFKITFPANVRSFKGRNAVLFVRCSTLNQKLPDSHNPSEHGRACSLLHLPALEGNATPGCALPVAKGPSRRARLYVHVGGGASLVRGDWWRSWPHLKA